MSVKREATPQQKLFIDYYLRGRKSNATKAAIDAGYAPKHASSQASNLLKNPHVMAYLKEREAELVQELKEQFFFDAQNARKVLADILKDDTAKDTDRITVAKDFLDRAGFKAGEHMTVDMQVVKKLEDFL